jgi:DNA polymerase-1
MISALTTKDKNKLKVYTDGMCSHCFNAFGYYKDQMPDINNSVQSINSIKTKYPDLRQSSKTKTFLLTYGGTYHGLMSHEGLSKKDAKRIEESYHTLYKESDDWVAAKIEQAKIDGYVTGAFGLRLRTPLLAKTIGKFKVPYAAKQESRTAGNMLGQSYGMLNTRAANEFMQRVWQSPYIYNILPVCQIHDSIYIMFKNSAKIAHWVNTNLIECMEWCGLNELKHPTVKLGAELDVYFPNWNYGTTLPNKSSKQEIKAICLQAEKEEKARKLIKP